MPREETKDEKTAKQIARRADNEEETINHVESPAEVTPSLTTSSSAPCTAETTTAVTPTSSFNGGV